MIDVLILAVIPEETGGIACRRESGKALKIMNEVCLVVIPASERNLRPLYFSLNVNAVEHALKTSNSAEGFRSEAGLVVEELRKSAVAHPDGVEYCGDSRRVRVRAEPMRRESDGWVQFQRAHELPHQSILRGGEHGREAAVGLEQPVAHAAGSIAPSILKRKIAVHNLGRRHPEERKGPSRTKLNPEHALLLQRINDKRFRARARQHCLPECLKTIRALPVINADGIVAKIKDDACLTGRHQAFFAMRNWCALAIPETPYEMRKRS